MSTLKTAHLIDTNGKEFIIDEPPAEAVEITGDWESETLSAPVEVIASILRIFAPKLRV